MFQVVFVAFILLLLSIDAVFVTKGAWRSQRLYMVILLGACVVAIAPRYFTPVAEGLGVGRLVDVVLYFTTVILVRELFISRARYVRLERRLTLLGRGVALEGVQQLARRRFGKD